MQQATRVDLIAMKVRSFIEAAVFGYCMVDLWRETSKDACCQSLSYPVMIFENDADSVLRIEYINAM